MGTTPQGPHRTSALFRATHLRCSAHPTLTSRLTAGIAIVSLLMAAPPVFALGSAPPRHSGAPIILAVRVPGDTLVAGQTLHIVAEVKAVDPSRLEYQFVLDGQTIQPWSTQASCQRLLTLEDLGERRLLVQVRDPQGQAERETSVYVIRQPVYPTGHATPSIR